MNAWLPATERRAAAYLGNPLTGEHRFRWQSSTTLSELAKRQVQRAHICRFPCGEPAELPCDIPFTAVDNAAWWTRRIDRREVAAPGQAYVSMRTNQPLTITVEQAAEILGIGRSTTYELVRSGDLACIRLRRRIVVPVSHLAERLGVDSEAVWAALAAASAPGSTESSRVALWDKSPAHLRTRASEAPASLF